MVRMEKVRLPFDTYQQSAERLFFKGAAITTEKIGASEGSVSTGRFHLEP